MARTITARNTHLHTHNPRNADGRLMASFQIASELPDYANETLVSYFHSLREMIVEQFRDTPYDLSRAEAEQCATAIMKVLEHSPRHTKTKSVELVNH